MVVWMLNTMVPISKNLPRHCGIPSAWIGSILTVYLFHIWTMSRSNGIINNERGNKEGKNHEMLENSVTPAKDHK